MNVAGLIPAAGAGARMGRGPKAFLPLAGRPLLAWAAERLAPVCDELLVAVPAGHADAAARIVPHARVLIGGATRQETVARLAAATDATFVLVHDVARPLAPTEVARAVLAATRSAGAAVSALPVADTLHDEVADRPVDRGPLRAVQTPQGFRRDWLLRAHEQASRTGAVATDDAQLVRALGHRVELVPGSPFAAKATLEQDLVWLEALAVAAPNPAR